MKIRLQQSQIKFLVGWLVLLILGVVAFYFLHYTDQANELEQTKQELAIEEQRNGALEKEINEQEADGTTLEQLHAQLPEGLDEEGLIQIIDQTADRRNIAIGSYLFDEPLAVTDEQGNSLGIIEQALTLNGTVNSTQSIENFAADLEAADRIFHIGRYSYQNQDDQEMSFQLQVIVYGVGEIQAEEEGN